MALKKKPKRTATRTQMSIRQTVEFHKRLLAQCDRLSNEYPSMLEVYKQIAETEGKSTTYIKQLIPKLRKQIPA